MEQHLLEMVRKPWVVLLRLQDTKSCDVVAKHWLNKPGATYREFMQATGVDLRLYMNHYIEVGGEDAPTSPILPATLTPILVLRKAGPGKTYQPLVMEIKGFFHETKDIGWVRTEKWEELLGDQDYLEKNFPAVEKQSDKGRKQVMKYASQVMTHRGIKP